MALLSSLSDELSVLSELSAVFPVSEAVSEAAFYACDSSVCTSLSAALPVGLFSSEEVSAEEETAVPPPAAPPKLDK